MQFWSLTGTTSYVEASALQMRIVELRARDLITDTILFLEHDPVITRGRGLQFAGVPRERHMPVDPAQFPPTIAFADSERGGDLTYHGPGQLVIYPICKLDGRGLGPRHDVGLYLRLFERMLIEEFETMGLRPHTRKNATGIWVNNKKVASMGIAIRKWVSYHGIAINCVNDLAPFFLISPCGFQPEVMTRLSDLLRPGNDLTGLRWRKTLEARLASRISGAVSPWIDQMTCSDAMKRLDQYEAAIQAHPQMLAQHSQQDRNRV